MKKIVYKFNILNDYGDEWDIQSQVQEYVIINEINLDATNLEKK